MRNVYTPLKSQRLIFLWPVLLLALFASCGGLVRTTVSTMPEGPRITQVNDSLFAIVLGSAVQPNGAVSYNTLRFDSDLTIYLRQLALIRTDIFTSRQAELAFWLNAHNAYVLDIIRSNLPLQSISDISGFRSAKTALIGGSFYSLDDIEHGILTRQFREPRAFFALFDGTRSSPPLLGTPYTESHLSEQLDHQLNRFLSDSTKNFIDRKANTIYLSERFQEYSSEIESAAGTMAVFLSTYAPAPMSSWINMHSTMHISYLGYDQTLYTSDIQTFHESTTQQSHKQPSRKPSGGIK